MLHVNIIESAFKFWANTGIAHGWLYQILSQKPHLFKNRTLLRHLYNGITIECNLEDHIQKQIYFFGAYEPIELDLFLSVLQPGDIVVDAGANIGFYSLMIANKIGDTGEVHSFEPILNNFERFKNNINTYNKIKNIYPNQIALWNKNENLSFYHPKGVEPNCGTYRVNNNSSTDLHHCQATTLQDYFQKHNLQSFNALKMDVEGSELFVLEGAIELINKYKPIILLEVNKITCEKFNYHPQKILDLIKPYGYKVYKIECSSYTSHQIGDFLNIDQKNVLLIPDEKWEKLDKFWDAKKIKRKFLNFF